MICVKEAILSRRSIRKFNNQEVSDEIINELLDAARHAPSACNSQPWRFKVVRDEETKEKLAEASFNQKIIANAPVVLVCCSDIKGYIEGSKAGSEYLYKSNVLEKDFFPKINNRNNKLINIPKEQLIPEVDFNVAIAVEHIVLRAVELGLGSCWVRLANGKTIREIFNFDENINFVTLLLLGYPYENPKERKKLSIDEIVLD